MKILTLSLFTFLLFGCKHDTILDPITTVEPTAKIIPVVKDDYVLEKSNPWIEFSPDYKPTESVQNLDYEFTILADNSIYGAFILSNADSIDQTLSFEISNTSSITLKLYEVKQVTTNTGKAYADPIVAVGSTISLPKNTAQLFMFQLKGISTGISNASISIDNGNQKKNIVIKSKSMMPSVLLEDLNAVNWGQLHYPMLTNRREVVGPDFQEHHINTAVIRSNQLPPLGATDFSTVTEHASFLKNMKNILLYTYPTNKIKDAPFMSEAWKMLFMEWYSHVLKAISSTGISTDNIYFYPYDEVKSDKVQELALFYNWGKQAVPDFRMFSTVVSRESANQVVSLVEITALIHLHDPGLVETPFPKKGELWLYNTFGHTYALSPYSYYRLMAWVAYYREMKGIGFWTYAQVDKRNDNPINTVIDEASTLSYSIIYTGERKEIISSRRWEAFSLGIEDHRILLLYERKFGKEKTKEMVRKVLSAKDNYDLAEQTRDEMIDAL